MKQSDHDRGGQDVPVDVDNDRLRKGAARIGDLRAEIARLRAALMTTECELNAATNGVYLPHRFNEQASSAPEYDAAPDMLAALKAVVTVADRKTVEFDMARAAIARAEGRQ